MNIKELFEKIHDVYESHDGGVIYLPKEKEEFIKKLLTEQLTIPAVVGQSEQFICRDCEKPSKEYRDQLCEPCHKWHTDS